MLNMVNAKSRLENDLRGRIKRKFSFENYKIDIQPSEYFKGNDIVLTFSYQRMEQSDFSFMDFSKFDKHMIDYKKMIDFLVSKCVLNGSFTFLGEYNPRVVCGVEGGGLAIAGSDLHIESIQNILGAYKLNDLSNDNDDLPLEKIWMKKGDNVWIGLSDEEEEEIDKELIFDVSFLKSIMDVIQNEIYDYLLALYPDESRLIGVDAKVPMLASDYDEPRSIETDWAAATDYEPPF